VNDSLAAAFALINIAIMPLWFGLIFMPRKKWVRPAIDGFFFAAAALFFINLIPGLADAMPVLLKPTLEGVAKLLSTPQGAFGSWTHFVIGDLWVGRFIAEDGPAHGIARPWIIALLLVTLLFGPVGLLSYFILKLILTGRFGTAPAAGKSR